MRKVLWFIGLKIVEIAFLVFAPYYVGKWAHSHTESFCTRLADGTTAHSYDWPIGLVVILLGLVIGGLCLGLVALNVFWAKKLSKR